MNNTFESMTEERPTAQVHRRQQHAGACPVSVIIPIRDRGGNRLRNSIGSLRWQRDGAPAEVMLIDNGSRPDVAQDLKELADELDITLIRVGEPHDAWCKPLALNTGIQASRPASPYVMTMDADMVLQDNFMSCVHSALTANANNLVLCQSSDLPRLGADTRPIALAEFDALRRRSRLRGTYGTGGIQAVRRSFLLEVRGYDEDMRWWGAMDNDMVRRARAHGMDVVWISDQTSMLHQWHTRKHRAVTNPVMRRDAQSAWAENHQLMRDRSQQIIRNQAGWGATLDEPDTR